MQTFQPGNSKLMAAFTFRYLFLVSAAFGLSSCQKEPHPSGNQEPQPLLKKVEYKSFNAAGAYLYNTDSSLKQIVYSSQTGSSYTFDLVYQDKKIVQTSLSNSLYKTKYHYASDGKIRSIFQSVNGEEKRGMRFDYTYNPNGSVTQMKYYTVNEAGPELVYDNVYSYDAAGRLKTIESINGNNKIIFSIDSYSEECFLNPWTFIGVSLSELYQIYNYPILKTMKRLPKKITQTVLINGGAPEIKKIYETVFTIRDKKIEKTIGSVMYPGDPAGNTRAESVFAYY